MNNNPIVDGKRHKLGFDYFSTGFSQSQLSNAYYQLCANRQQERLLFETATLCEVEEVYNNPGDENDRLTTEEMVMEAIRIQKYSRADSKMAALVRVFNGYLKDKNIEALAPVVGTPKKSGLFATVTAQIPFSDGQVVSIIFHSPDNNKMKIAADDEIIAFRWLLNKRDITHVVSPENDAEVSLQEIGKRTAQLVEKNSARFQVMQKDLIEQKKKLDETKTLADEVVKKHDDLMSTLKEGQDTAELTDAKIVNLKDRILKQQAFNEDLQAKIDGLKAQQAGNDGKAAGGGTPKTEEEMKAEQERVSATDSLEKFISELKGRGLNQTNQDKYSGDSVYFQIGTLKTWTFKGKGKLGEKYFYTTFTMNDTGDKDTEKKEFNCKSASGMDSMYAKALAWIDKKLVAIKSTTEDKEQFVAAANSDEVVTMTREDYDVALKKYKLSIAGGPVEPEWAWSIRRRLEGKGFSAQVLAEKFLDLYDKAIDDAKSYVRIGLAYAIKEIPDYESNADLVEIKNKVTNFYPSVEGLIKNIAANGLQAPDTVEAGGGDVGNEDTTAQEQEAAVNAAGEVDPAKVETNTETTGSAEPAAVTILNDILAGKYDGDTTKMGDVLDNAAADLERDGKAQEYDALLNQCADYLTETLKKEAA